MIAGCYVIIKIVIVHSLQHCLMHLGASFNPDNQYLYTEFGTICVPFYRWENTNSRMPLFVSLYIGLNFGVGWRDKEWHCMYSTIFNSLNLLNRLLFNEVWVSIWCLKNKKQLFLLILNKHASPLQCKLKEDRMSMSNGITLMGLERYLL